MVIGHYIIATKSDTRLKFALSTRTPTNQASAGAVKLGISY